MGGWVLGVISVVGADGLWMGGCWVLLMWWGWYVDGWAQLDCLPCLYSGSDDVTEGLSLDEL